jgi:hypothetical protein
MISFGEATSHSHSTPRCSHPFPFKLEPEPGRTLVISTRPYPLSARPSIVAPTPSAYKQPLPHEDEGKSLPMS